MVNIYIEVNFVDNVRLWARPVTSWSMVSKGSHTPPPIATIGTVVYEAMVWGAAEGQTFASIPRKSNWDFFISLYTGARGRVGGLLPLIAVFSIIAKGQVRVAEHEMKFTILSLEGVQRAQDWESARIFIASVFAQNISSSEQSACPMAKHFSPFSSWVYNRFKVSTSGFMYSKYSIALHLSL